MSATVASQLDPEGLCFVSGICSAVNAKFHLTDQHTEARPCKMARSKSRGKSHAKLSVKLRCPHRHLCVPSFTEEVSTAYQLCTGSVLAALPMARPQASLTCGAHGGRCASTPGPVVCPWLCSSSGRKRLLTGGKNSSDSQALPRSPRGWQSLGVLTQGWTKKLSLGTLPAQKSQVPHLHSDDSPCLPAPDSCGHSSLFWGHRGGHRIAAAGTFPAGGWNNFTSSANTKDPS